MKKIVLSICALSIMSMCTAQVVSDKVKNTIGGKNEPLMTKFEKVRLDNFQITYSLYNGASDAAGTSTVSVMATLSNIDEALIQEITDEAYAYYIDQWKKRGAVLESPTKEELVNSKKYKKYAEKGQARLAEGKPYKIQDKTTDAYVGYPSNVFIAFGESYPAPAAIGNGAHLPSDFKGDYYWAGYSFSVNFMNFKTAKFGNVASVRGNEQLNGYGSLGVSAWEKAKVGFYTASQELEGTGDFFNDKKQETRNILGSKASTWVYDIDREKYKVGVLALVKQNMDEMFADYDAFKAKK